MPQGFEPINKDSASEAIVKQILNMIENGDLEPGAKLPAERIMAESFGVSRPPVREAMRALSMLGFVNIIPGSGTYLCDNVRELVIGFNRTKSQTGYNVDQLSEARRILETQLITLACERAIDKDIEEIEKLHVQIADSVDDKRTFLKYDRDFHLRIAQSAGNEYLYTPFVELEDLILDFNMTLMDVPGQFDRVIRDHSFILDTLKTRDARKAVRAVTSHVQMLNV